jgi:hypothetical protein
MKQAESIIGSLLGLLLKPEDGGEIFLRNVDCLSTYYMELCCTPEDCHFGVGDKGVRKMLERTVKMRIAFNWLKIARNVGLLLTTVFSIPNTFYHNYICYVSLNGKRIANDELEFDLSLF